MSFYIRGYCNSVPVPYHTGVTPNSLEQTLSVSKELTEDATQLSQPSRISTCPASSFLNMIPIVNWAAKKAQILAGKEIIISQTRNDNNWRKELKGALKDNLCGIPFKLETADGEALEAMYIPGIGCKRSDKTVIIFCGILEYGYEYADFAELFTENHYNTVLFNYRGVGKSSGQATKEGLIYDAKAAIDFVLHQCKVELGSIWLYGHSMGGGVALEIATYYPKINVICDRTYRSLSKAAEVTLGEGTTAKLAAISIKGIGWEFSSSENVQKLKDDRAIIVLTHPQDKEIPFKSCLLGAVSKEQTNVFNIVLDKNAHRARSTRLLRSSRSGHLRELYHEEKLELLDIMAMCKNRTL